MKQAVKIFNRSKLLSNKSNFPKLQDLNKEEQISSIYKNSSENLCYQLASIRKIFSNIALISSAPHIILDQLPNNVQPENLFLCDTTPELLNYGLKNLEKFSEKYPKCKVHPLIIEEELWCFKPETLDLIISNHNLHWVNDLQVAFLRFLDSLKPDGAFIGCVYGADTLEELRISLTLAESERNGGISQHVNPFISIIEVGNLLARCSFNLPTVYTERKLMLFDSSLHLMQFLQNMGENNSLLNIRPPFHLYETMFSAMAIYDHLFKYQEDPLLIACTIEEIYFLGWKYHESQQKPKKRGSAQFSLKDIQTEILENDKNSKVEYGEIYEEDEEKNPDDKKDKT